ncbi:hypothetical protein JZ751_027096 [Albula glossodonta]|uniref:Uncharacterized protein n=1 Tax=Albula glossodonta TaxID=121402 RepID=A0A8T2NCP3_9TELE|nr:hypothetical protein JZ751_027096 [Albula glossodonta]
MLLYLSTQLLPACTSLEFTHSPTHQLLTKAADQTVKDKALQSMASMSSAQIVSATAIHNKLGLPGIPRPAFPGAAGVKSLRAIGPPRPPHRHPAQIPFHTTRLQRTGPI